MLCHVSESQLFMVEFDSVDALKRLVCWFWIFAHEPILSRVSIVKLYLIIFFSIIASERERYFPTYSSILTVGSVEIDNTRPWGFAHHLRGPFQGGTAFSSRFYRDWFLVPQQGMFDYSLEYDDLYFFIFLYVFLFYIMILTWLCVCITWGILI